MILCSRRAQKSRNASLALKEAHRQQTTEMFADIVHFTQVVPGSFAVLGMRCGAPARALTRSSRGSSSLSTLPTCQLV